MYRLLALLLTIILFTSASWRTDFSVAKTEAAQHDKYILLKFSGSDWCLPCIRMEKKVFDDAAFQDYAKDKLIFINADFPQKKSNMPAKEVVASNEMLAEQYNKDGHFPLTLLLDADGNVVKTWDGYKGEAPQEFINDIKAVINE